MTTTGNNGDRDRKLSVVAATDKMSDKPYYQPEPEHHSKIDQIGLGAPEDHDENTNDEDLDDGLMVDQDDENEDDEDEDEDEEADYVE